MTTSYLCKRCKTLAFAKGFEYLEQRYSKEELSDENVIFIGDEVDGSMFPEEEDAPTYEWLSNPLSILDIQHIDSSRTPLVVVELARRKHHSVTVPVECDTDVQTIEELDCSKLNIDEDGISEFKSAVITHLEDPNYLVEKQLSKEFCMFIMHVYTNISDGHNKLLLLNLLNANNVDTTALESKFPVCYHEVDAYDVVNTTPFEDIKIIINKDDINASSNSSIYKHSPDDLKKAAVGNSTQLEAFSKNKFTVIHNKKSANIENYISKRNHDVLDSLARNGVVCSPNTEYELSLCTLMKALRRFKNFDIVFIHPSYELKITRAEYPSEIVEPSYIVNEGELLAVAYRFITVNYFGYCSVFNSEMEEFNYLI